MSICIEEESHSGNVPPITPQVHPQSQTPSYSGVLGSQLKSDHSLGTADYRQRDISIRDQGPLRELTEIKAIYFFHETILVGRRAPF